MTAPSTSSAEATYPKSSGITGKHEQLLRRVRYPYLIYGLPAKDGAAEQLDARQTSIRLRVIRIGLEAPRRETNVEAIIYRVSPAVV